MQTLAAIATAQDLAINSPTQRFVVGRNWNYNQTGIAELDELVNRPAFSWQNANDIKMWMDANGRTRIGSNLNTNNVINNRFEIVAQTNDAYGSVIPTNGASGLRLVNLTSIKTPVTNPGTGVLSVDVNGDVIYVPGITGASLGNICGAATTNPLTNDWEIPLNAHNFVFSGQGTSNYNVGIGTNCSPVAKLDVVQNSTNANSTAVMVQNSDQYGIGVDVKAKGPWGVRSIAYTADPTVLTTIGVSGVADCANSIKGNIGVYGEAMDNISNDNMGGFFISKTPGVLNNTGAIGYANNAKLNNTGGIFQAISSVAGYPTKNVGAAVLAWGPSSLPNIALYAQVDVNRPQDYAGYFDGNVYINGPTSGTGYAMASDALFKTNIDTITDAMSIINELKPKHYYYDTTNVYGLHFSSKKQYGLIAQEVEQVLPEMVGKAHQNAQKDTAGNVITQATDYKTVNYNALFAILIKGMQEQQAKIDSLTTKLNSKDSLQDARLTILENAITQCCSNNNAKTSNNSAPAVLNSLDVELSDKDVIVLDQNVPNPFAEQTSITYNVPQSVGKAQILFYNTNGQLIQTVDIKTRGKGKVNVFASDLSSGLYHYTLVADGKVVDSKKMVRE